MVGDVARMWWESTAFAAKGENATAATAASHSRHSRHSHSHKGSGGRGGASDGVWPSDV